jgi:hypothetical protein
LKYVGCISVGKQCFHRIHVPYAPAAGACGSVLGLNTMIQVESSGFHSLRGHWIFQYHNPFSRTLALELAQPLDRNEYQESSWG